jgi:release factor glutamine methyltransferase
MKPPKWLFRLAYAFWRPWLKRRLGRVVVETVEGEPLVVLPRVFNPAVFRSGRFLARTLATAPELVPGDGDSRALDLGTGSGVGAVFAVRRGWDVVAVDVNPDAVRCARINALLHGLEERIEAREGDLFAPVAGERFDLVLFNPPYFPGEARDALDAAWRGRGVLERFAAGLPEALTPGGRALVVFSSDGDEDALLALLEGNGLRVRVLARRESGTETFTAYVAEHERAA